MKPVINRFLATATVLVLALVSVAFSLEHSLQIGKNRSLKPSTDKHICNSKKMIKLSPGRRKLCGVGIFINRDSAEFLRYLPGIGKKRAEKIVRFRNEKGPFETPEELMKIKGIGKKTLEKIRPWLEDL